MSPSFSRSASLHTARRVPRLSNRSTNMKEKMFAHNETFRAPMISSLKAIGAMLGGMETMPAGKGDSLKIMPSRVVTRMPIRMDPLTLRISRMTMRRSPNSPRRTVLFMVPSPTRTASFLTMSPRPCMPIKAMNKPMPTEVAILREGGMALTIFSRIPRNVRIRKMTPETKTTPSASCHATPCPRTRVKAKKALSPIPGAIMMGALAHSPMSMEDRPATMQVTVISAPLSIPVLDRMFGFTKTM